MWQHCLLDLFMRIAHDLEQILEGLTVEELHYQPNPASNSVAWHLTQSPTTVVPPSAVKCKAG